MKCEIIDTGIGSAQENMDYDAELFKTLHNRQRPLLHLYSWKRPSITYGYFIRKENFFKPDCEIEERDIAKRPTGGGIIFHNGDLAFSLLVPSNHPAFSSDVFANYASVNACVAEIMKDLCIEKVSLIQDENVEPEDRISRNFCMAKITKYDVVLNGRKIGGSAQRMNRSGFLHQGSIFLSGPSDEECRRVFRDDVADVLIRDLRRRSCFILGVDSEPDVLAKTRKSLIIKLISALERRF